MLNSGKVAKNAMWIIGCRCVQAILAVIISMLTARYLGPSNFGTITYATSLTAFVLPITYLGFNSVIVHELISNPAEEGKTLGTCIFYSLCSALICILSIGVFASFVNYGEKETIVVCVLYSVILVFNALDLIVYWFQAKCLSKYTSLTSFFAYVIISGYRIYLLIEQKSIYWFAISNALDYAIISIVSIVIYYKIGGKHLCVSPKLAKEIFTKSKYYIIANMMVTLFAQTDKIMLKIMKDETITGYYGAAIACAGMTGFVFVAIIDSFRPAIFEGMHVSETEFTRRLKYLQAIVFYMSLVQSIVMTMGAYFFIVFLYGKDYLNAVNALQIVVWYTTFSYIGSVRNIWILANNKQEYLWKINLIGALTNIFLNLLLIPRFGACGAAATSLFTQIFTNVVLSYLIKPIRPCFYLIWQSASPRLVFSAVKEFSTSIKSH